MNLPSIPIIPWWVKALVIAGLVSAAGVYGCHQGQAVEHTARLAEVRGIRLVEARQVAAVAQAARVAQHAQDQITTTSAVAEAAAQERIITRTITLTQEVPRYVTTTVERRIGCVPWGLVRVLDAAASGANPADLIPPAGQPDDACSPVTPLALGQSVVANYGVAHQNAEQLDALIGDITQRVNAANAGRELERQATPPLTPGPDDHSPPSPAP